MPLRIEDLLDVSEQDAVWFMPFHLIFPFSCIRLLSIALIVSCPGKAPSITQIPSPLPPPHLRPTWHGPAAPSPACGLSTLKPRIRKLLLHLPLRLLDVMVVVDTGAFFASFSRDLTGLGVGVFDVGRRVGVVLHEGTINSCSLIFERKRNNMTSGRGFGIELDREGEGKRWDRGTAWTYVLFAHDVCCAR
jgi:hypothetical protein